MRNTKRPNILFEDEHILVCFKPAGVPVQTKSASVPDMESILKNHLMKCAAQTGGRPYLAVIHRLDQPVEGLLVFAKTPEAARKLNSQLQSGGFGKHYKAIVCGTLPAASGVLTNYLVKDGRTNTSRVCDKNTPDAKYAELSYEVLRVCSDTDRTLIRIKLKTGRHHQIRVQMAAAGTPLLGDTKYNPEAAFAKDRRGSANGKQLALCAYRLSFRHPVTGKPMEFELNENQTLCSI